jgi:hypothetical protein
VTSVAINALIYRPRLRGKGVNGCVMKIHNNA